MLLHCGQRPTYHYSDITVMLDNPELYSYDEEVMDQTHDRHSYDSRCRCSNCVAYEKSLRIAIKNEKNGYELTSGPNNIKLKELRLASTLHAKLDKTKAA